jgi:hypothetical protein
MARSNEHLERDGIQINAGLDNGDGSSIAGDGVLQPDEAILVADEIFEKTSVELETLVGDINAGEIL